MGGGKQYLSTYLSSQVEREGDSFTAAANFGSLRFRIQFRYVKMDLRAYTLDVVGHDGSVPCI